MEAPKLARGMVDLITQHNDGKHRCAFIVQFAQKECQQGFPEKIVGYLTKSAPPAGGRRREFKVRD